MSDIRDEPNEQVAAMLARRFPRWESYLRHEIADRVDSIYAERIAQARHEGAAEALEAFAIGCDETARTAYTSEARHFAEAYARRARDRAAALRGDA